MNLHKKFRKVILPVCAFLLLAGVLVNFSDIASRGIVGRSIPWAQQVTVWCVIAVSFLVAGIQVRDGTHISVDFISDKLRGLSKKIVQVISSFVVALVSCLLLASGVTLVKWVYDKGTVLGMGTWAAPVWIPYLICMVIGMAILVVYSIVEFIGALWGLRK